MKSLNKLTLNNIISSGSKITFTYKKYVIVYSNGYVTIYNSKKEYLNSFILNVKNYSFTEWKSIIKNYFSKN